MAAEQLSEEQFWHAIAILIKNYQAVNKNIFDVQITQVQQRQNGKLVDCLDDEELEQQMRADAPSRTCEAFDDFEVRLSEGKFDITILSTLSNKSARFAEFILQPKLWSWSQSKRKVVSQKSLRLVNVEKYNDLYKELKKKHVQRLLEYWQTSKESTDPLKFIHEDLAIAAYLIILWSSTQAEFKAFGDLGCGNGLLVHVLNAEGYKGYGYDVRKRKLWSVYPEETKNKLIEQTVEPKSFQLDFEGIDWLIGNHSDELSPWLPILATRLGTNFFLLPCCPFELSGRKFIRRNTGISAYQDFVQYAEQLTIECGFETLRDRLKIPSTKRLAIIGLKTQVTKSVKCLEDFIQQQLQRNGKEMQIKLREKTESVRNCTQVDKGIIDVLVFKIFKMLLDSATETAEASWLPGGQLSMRQIAQALSKAELAGIKSECGGIKTLLRNKHEIFEFCGQDLIGIRKPQVTSMDNAKNPLTIKKRACFFNQNHPQGCPLEESSCSFIH
ncbi:CG9386 [Drosophila busckii]|uniref:tRNA (uracil-O(2)-)-methyltransferase n=1 Tax=Drosophila busckii TaxID=30019 RepID=A0A0M4F5N8_DROBS|nr:CG9386 [Drosophila busckii]